MSNPDWQREAQRQQRLVQALAGDRDPAQLQGWLRTPPAQLAHGWRAYQANAAATARRALAAAYPTVQRLLGPESFAALALALWQAHPPRQGDLAAWGEALPGYLAEAAALAAEPYLPDMARLDWAVHQAERARDDDAPATGLQQLASGDPAHLTLHLRAGHAVLCSSHPVHTLWLAHHDQPTEGWAPARRALANADAEAVRVRRHGWQAVVERIDAPTAQFELCMLQGAALATALAQADSAFVFEAWFINTLRRGGLAGVSAAARP
jgi:hypothetical protein